MKNKMRQIKERISEKKEFGDKLASYGKEKERGRERGNRNRKRE